MALSGEITAAGLNTEFDSLITVLDGYSLSSDSTNIEFSFYDLTSTKQYFYFTVVDDCRLSAVIINSIGGDGALDLLVKIYSTPLTALFNQGNSLDIAVANIPAAQGFSETHKEANTAYLGLRGGAQYVVSVETSVASPTLDWTSVALLISNKQRRV